ncbi:hypothetical protein AB0F91_36020 [Amycolatopsis sp. NPDC023774]|uniref:hypothetical protein n=1 Tax=Amycolatopsis sp. NPDC023774 TaxID=3155015 RepID=UPI0033F057D8
MPGAAAGDHGDAAAVAGQCRFDRERSAVRVGDQTMRGAQLAAIDPTRPACSPVERVRMRAIHQSCRQVEQAGAAKLGEQLFMQLPPHPDLDSLGQPAPAGRAESTEQSGG